jgi:hypothetical protein
LGNGSDQSSGRPVTVTASYTGTVAQIEVGQISSCLRTVEGGVWCWGLGDQGRLGNGGNGSYATPQPVIGLSSGVVDISLSYATGCALITGGSAKCWGFNEYGQVGNNSNINAAIPVDVAGMGSGVTAITAGGIHSCAVTTWGGVRCWGRNVNGELGTGQTSGDQRVPVTASNIPSAGMLSLQAGYETTCGVYVGGELKCLGQNVNGMLGVGNDAGPVLDLTRPVGISGGVSSFDSVGFTCAVVNGTVGPPPKKWRHR